MFLKQMTRNINVSTLNPRVLGAKYAVRGEIVQAAAAHAETLARGTGHTLPFDRIVYCNIGNPQSLAQRPLTFPRQVMSCVVNPELLEHDPPLFPRDVSERAKSILGRLSGGSVGAYSDSTGSRFVKEDVAAFIEARDGHRADPGTIFVTNGASDAIGKILTTVIRDDRDGVMIPIPQYPLYSATIDLLGGAQVPYYLDEDEGWGLTRAELERSYEDAVARGVVPRAMAIISPGNPVGAMFSRAVLEDVVRFCEERDVLLLSDEVYQPNVYGAAEFVSAKKVVADLGSALPLASFHSTSKGFLGECGFRGGYCELHNFDPEVSAQIFKLASIHLCSNLPGQVMTSLMVRPPAEGDESHATYAAERDAILASLSRRARTLRDALVEMEGVTCNAAEGAMYLFPQIRLPERAVAAARDAGMSADGFYCLELLNETGICVVPGSGFLQRDGTYHFRTTFLPPEDEINVFAKRIGEFHKAFLDKYR